VEFTAPQLGGRRHYIPVVPAGSVPGDPREVTASAIDLDSLMDQLDDIYRKASSRTFSMVVSRVNGEAEVASPYSLLVACQGGPSSVSPTGTSSARSKAASLWSRSIPTWVTGARPKLATSVLGWSAAKNARSSGSA
jgi:hypothetical protein